MMRWLLLVLMSLLGGCGVGHGVRGQVGPSWSPDEGMGAMAQVQKPGMVGLLGIYLGLRPSLWGRVGVHGAAVGVGLSAEIGGMPTEEPSRPQRGMGWHLGEQISLGTNGWEFGGDLTLKYTESEIVKKTRHSMGSSKMGSYYTYYHDQVSWGGTAQFSALFNGDISHVALLFMMESLKLQL